MEFNLAQVLRAVADAVPDREAIVHPGGRLTFGRLLERVDRLAAVLAEAGLGVHRERAELAPWESGQDHLALYLHNGPRVPRGHVRRLQGPGGAVQRELPLRGRGAAVPPHRLAGPAAIVYHSTFAPVLAEVRAELPELAAAAPGPRRQRHRPAARRAAGTTTPSPACTPRPPAERALARRPLHPLHRRHHRHAEGRAVAPGRHLPGGPRRSAARPPARSRPDLAAIVETPRNGGARMLPSAPVHARRRALAGVQRARPGQHHRAAREHRDLRPRRRVGHRRARGASASS